MNKLAKFFTTQNIARILLAICFLGLTYLNFSLYKKNVKKVDEQNNIYKTLQDSIQTHIDKEGKLVEKISVLESSNYKYLVELRTKDSSVIELQKVLMKYKDKMNKSGSTALVVERIIQRDSVVPKYVNVEVKDGLYYLKDTLEDKWIFNSYERRGNESLWNLKIKDDFSIAVFEEKDKKTVELTNNNPYSQTKNLKVWQFKDESKNKNWGIGLQVGYGVSLNDLLKPSPYVGVGVSRNIIKF